MAEENQVAPAEEAGFTFPKREVQYAKDIDDIMVLFVETVKVIRSGGDYAQLLDELIEAINGADNVDEEFEASLQVTLNTIGGRSGDIAEAFRVKKAS